MRFARTYVIVFLSLVPRIPAFPQTATTTSTCPQRDPQAETIVQRALSKMGYTEVTSRQNTIARGTVVHTGPGQSKQGSVVFKTGSPGQFRTEINFGEGTRTVIRNGEHAVVSNLSGLTVPLRPQDIRFVGCRRDEGLAMLTERICNSHPALTVA